MDLQDVRLEICITMLVICESEKNFIARCIFFVFFSCVRDVWHQWQQQHLLLKDQALLQYILFSFLLIKLQEVIHTGTSAGENTTNSLLSMLFCYL